ncbi:MAG TPA: AAA family ATPase [Gammaproteobacteria bacterium]|nr:AAA family ATPase [Gammaproteobacteria bacterium]
MIKKLIKFQNLGLLRDACAAGTVDFGRVTAIYADNGRGKSALAAAIRACQLRDAGRMNARKTLDSADSPVVDLLLSTGAHIEFKANVWTGNPPAIAVFDSEFVEQNVYSGFEIRPDQRQALLEFALGDRTVALKKQVEQLSQSIKDQTTIRTAAEKTLGGLASPYTVKEFIALRPVPDAQAQIDALRKHIEAAKSAQQLGTRQSPASLQALQFDVYGAFSLLGKTLADVEQGAEAEVKAHLAKHAHPGIEAWVSSGQAYATEDDCPFCGQAIGGLSLIKAYQSYFNAAYEGLKADVAALEFMAAAALGDAKVDALEAAYATNVARIEAWTDQLNLIAPVLDAAALRNALTTVRTTVLDLIATKRQQPMLAVGTPEELRVVEVALGAINSQIAKYNQEVQEVATQIAEFKTKLATENLGILEAAIKQLEAAQRRQLPDTITTAAAYALAETERKKLEGEKTKARDQIDALMQTTLSQYQGAINQLLNSFGAEFAIEQLKPTYVGSTGEPRTEFDLRIRNKSVKLGSRADLASGHGFASTLSEADKRTLAFVFFVARLRADPNLADTIVVLDDPVSSLDRNRRQESKQLIARLATECHQLVLLSHDAYFVRDFRDRLRDLKPTPVPLTILALKRVQNGYSVFAPCDIDDMCSSDYYWHHKLVADFVDGKPSPSSRDVAKAIRPLLEGYYYRRFPGAIPRKLLFGQIVALAIDPATTGPLINIRPLAQELLEINDYARQFHHDTNPGADSVQVVDSELLGFARRALAVIYKNG